MEQEHFNSSLVNDQITRCEVCGHDELKEILNLGEQPLCDDLVPIGSDLSTPRFPIEILFCQVCRTAHQRFQVPKRRLFPSTYHYRARYTKDVVNGMRELVQSCEEHLGDIRNLKVLDIGCNDGTLLGIFKEKGCEVFGVEPTDAADDARFIANVINDYFDIKIAENVKQQIGIPDIITFTNVFAHIEDLKSLLRALEILIGNETTIVIENHYLGSILDRNQFDTFYHEHPRSYSAKSFYYIARALRSQLTHLEFPGRYGGNIRVFISKKGIPLTDEQIVADREILIGRQVFNLQNNYRLWRDKTHEALTEAINKYGPLPSKAFPGRASILINALNLNEKQISVVYEKPGSLKVNHYLPGTRIPIRSDKDLMQKIGTTNVLVNWAWHISDEIETYLYNLGFRGSLIDIMPFYNEHVIK
ncbi:MAG: methyltransferase domain-containing protein [Bacteroidetes bacterium]|nr:methyltransferase domain-containing protein [Bacteroidota bacterium]